MAITIPGNGDEKINLDDPNLAEQLAPLLAGMLGEGAAAPNAGQIAEIVQNLRVQAGLEGATGQTPLLQILDSAIKGLGLQSTVDKAPADGLNALLDIVEQAKSASEGGVGVIDTIKQVAASGQIHTLFKRKPVVKSGPQVGRNDKCPCGSGKKYKQCCMRK